MITTIASSDNQNFKRWKSLQESRGIKKHNQFIASGNKIVAELITKMDSNSELLVSENHDAPSDFDGKIYTLSSELFRRLDEFGTNSPLLVGTPPEIASWDQSSTPKEGLNLVCPLGDPANLGAVIRTATAFNCNSIILSGEAANPFLPKSIRSSVGTTLSAPLQRGPNLQELLDLPLNNFYALDLGGQDLTTFNWPKSIYLVIGEEGPGLPKHKLKKLTLKMNDSVESLNAVVATSLAIYSYQNSF